MLKTYVKSRELYKQKFISKTYKQEATPAMVLGQAVETYVSDGRKAFLSSFAYRVLKRDDPDTYEAQKDPNYPLSIMSETDFNKVITMGEKILSLPDMQYLLKNSLIHTVLEGKHGNLDLVGELDYLVLDEKRDKAVVVDLKTAQDVDMNKFTWKSYDFGYFTQAAYYKMLLEETYPGKYKNFEYYLVAINKEIVPKIAIYKVSEYEMELQSEFILKQLTALEESIANDDFKDPIPTFADALEIGRFEELKN